MFARLSIVSALALFGAAGGASAASLSGSGSGTVSGGNTVDFLIFVASDGAVINYTASGSGNGNNELDVKLQQLQVNGNWTTIDHPADLQMPSDSVNSSVVVPNELNGDELLRFRFGRKVLTSAIDWEVSW